MASQQPAFFVRDNALTNLSVSQLITTSNVLVRQRLLAANVDFFELNAVRADIGSLQIDDADILRLDATNGQFTSLQTTSLVVSDIAYPQADGLANQVLETNGAGELSFQYPLTVTTLNGQFMNFTGNSVEFCAWGTNSNNNASNPLLIPFDVELVAFSISYSENNTAISIGAGESVVFDVGLATADAPRNNANYTMLPGTSITWDTSVTGTYPQSSLTGLTNSVSAGSLIAMRCTETGTVMPTNAEVVVTVWLRSRFV